MSEQLIINRLAACQSCEHLLHGFCGTPIVGKTVTHRGREVHLCGCMMKIKARLSSSTCPLDKWPLDSVTGEMSRIRIAEDVVPEPMASTRQLKGKDINDIRIFLAEIKALDNIPWQMMQKLVKLHTKYIYPVQETGCTPCLQQMVKNLKASVK